MKKTDIIKRIDSFIIELKKDDSILISKYGVVFQLEELKQFVEEYPESKFHKGVSVLQHIEGNSITYSCDCDCGEGEHQVKIDFEFDKTFEIAVLTFFKNVECRNYIYRDVTWDDELGKKIRSSIWDVHDIFEIIKYAFDNTIMYYLSNFWKRLCGACKILFLGVIEVEEEFILRGEALDNFIIALNEGRDILKKQHDLRMKKIKDKKNRS